MRASIEMVRAIEEKARQRGLMPDDLCKAIGIHRATWQRWKNGRSAPDVDQWLALNQFVESQPIRHGAAA
jgi:hypothetical protein